MAEVRWTLQAADDLEAITEFIAEDSPNYACLFAVKVLAAVGRLETYPLIGRIVPELDNPAFREILLGSYRIPYRVMKDMSEILTVFHGAKPLDPSKF